MLTLRNARPDADPGPGWFAQSRGLLWGHALFAAAMLSVSVLGKGVESFDGAICIAQLAAGLL